MCSHPASEKDLGTSLIESVSQAGAVDVAADVGELALDSVLDVGLLKDVPVFGWLVKFYGAFRTVRDQLFLKKVASFLHGTRSASQEVRDRFRKKMKADPAFRRKVGECLILLLERHDHFDKSSILGKVFTAYMRGEIEYEAFLRIATSVDRVPITDLRRLSQYHQRFAAYDGTSGESFVNVLDADTCQSLYTSGLVSSEGAFEVTYRPNDVMSELVKLIEE